MIPNKEHLEEDSQRELKLQKLIYQYNVHRELDSRHNTPESMECLINAENELYEFMLRPINIYSLTAAEKLDLAIKDTRAGVRVMTWDEILDELMEEEDE